MATHSEQENLDPPIRPALPGSAGLRCPNCGYDLTGLTRDRCPECGASFDRAALIPQQQQGVLLPWETRPQISFVRRFSSTCYAAWLHPARYCDRIAQRCHVRVARPLGLMAGVISVGLMLCLLSDLTFLSSGVFRTCWHGYRGQALAQVAKDRFLVNARRYGLRDYLVDPSYFVSPLLSCAILSYCATRWFKERLGRLRTIDLFALLCVPASLWPCLFVLSHIMQLLSLESQWFYVIGEVYWLIFFYLAPRRILGIGRAASAGVAVAVHLMEIQIGNLVVFLFFCCLLE
jgi:hypothetical protein